MSSQLPAWHLYCGDLWKDNEFRLCGWQAQNLWLRMLILLHEHTPRGEFRLPSGAPMTDEQVAKLCEMPIADFAILLAELDSNCVFSRIAGAIANRRMVRERQVHENKVQAGQKGAQARWQKGWQDNGTSEQQKIADFPTYSSSSSSSSSSSISEKNKSVREDAKLVLEFLNEKTGKKFRPVDAHLLMIEARLKSGVDVQACKTLIVRKVRDWATDEKMACYLRPATLFNKTKFENYLAEVTK